MNPLQPSKKATKTDPKLATVAGNAKATAAAEAQAALDEPQESAQGAKPKPKKTTKEPVKKETNSKAKPARKSIGTLAQPKGKQKVAAKSIKKLVAAKSIDQFNDETDTAEYTDMEAADSSTPFAAAKQKRKGRAVK